MLRIIYKSKQRKPMSGADFDELCEHAKINNASSGVTGLLLKSETEFLQCIEGPVKNVCSTFKRICSDPRHYDIQVLEVKRILQRMFSQWTMYGVNYAHRGESEDLTDSGYSQTRPAPQALRRTWGRSGGGLTTYVYEHEQVYNMLKKGESYTYSPRFFLF